MLVAITDHDRCVDFQTIPIDRRLHMRDHKYTDRPKSFNLFLPVIIDAGIKASAVPDRNSTGELSLQTFHLDENWFLNIQLGINRTILKLKSTLATSGMLVKVFSRMRQATRSRFSGRLHRSTATAPPRDLPNTKILLLSTSGRDLNRRITRLL